ncbi:MAG: MFS transporter [Mycobacteriales bacterium]
MRDPAFLRFWVAQAVSLIGSQVSRLALPLTVVLTLGGGVAALSLVNALLSVPFLLFGLVVGVWVDRWPRVRVLVTADVVRGLTLASIPVAAALGILTLAWLCVVAFVVGTLTVFFDVAQQAILPSLVSRGRLPEANGKLSLTDSLSRFAGPSVGGVLVQVLSAPAAVLADALSFLASAALLRRLPTAGPPKPTRRAGLRAELVEGIRFVVGNRQVRTLAVAGSVLNLVDSAFTVLMLVFLADGLGLGAATIGLGFAIGSAGGLAAATLTPRVWARLGGPGTMTLALSAILAGRLAVGAMPQGAPAAALAILGLALAMTGMGSVAFNVVQVSIRQQVTPDDLLGRVNAAVRTVLWGVIPLGALLGGLLGSALPLRTAVLVTAAALVLPVLLLLPLRTGADATP